MYKYLCRYVQNNNLKTITAFGRDDFRKWLQKHHDKETKVCIILHKRHTGKPAPTHHELMEEAICFGWIDTTIKRLDEDKYVRNFCCRNTKSKWSYNTLGYAKKLIKEGRMTPAGLKFYRLGLQRPTHDAGIPKNPKMPVELKKELSNNFVAKKNFIKLPPSSKKMFYRWILHAKLSETRKKRIAFVVKNAVSGKKSLM